MNRSTHISEERIRERAYRLWLEEGQPQGKDAEHWEKARELLAMEDADPEEGKEPVDKGYNEPGPWGEPIEQASSLENQGEFPTTTDQGKQQVPKKQRPKVARRTPDPGKRRPM